MKRYFEKIETCLAGADVKLKEDTYSSIEGLRAVYGVINKEEALIVDGCKAFRFDGAMWGGKSGVRVCPMNHQNRIAMSEEFSFLAPQAFGRNTPTFGFGDRLGIATPGHLEAVTRSKIKPVLAQQSLRELGLSGRTYEQVLDAAVWACFKGGYKGGFGADGDHLKTLEEVRTALSQEVSMITLDGSLVLKEAPASAQERAAAYRELPEDFRTSIEEEYLGDEELERFGIHIDADILAELAVANKGLIDLAAEVYALIRKAGRPIDYELSLDETEYDTTAAAHYFVVRELDKRDVKLNSMAPRFVGEFQKGIDYIGDVAAFRENFRMHARIADLFGYKLSLHSGSDKFSVFPIVAQETMGRFHVKTSGTSWLEAARVIAKHNPKLYRDMHRKALDNVTNGQEHYVVKCNPLKIRPLDSLRDEELASLMDEEDARQLIHITYGYIISDPELKERILKTLNTYDAEYRKALLKHFSHHLELLGVMR